MQNKALAKKIAGEVTLAESPGEAMRKWREIFMVKQCELAGKLKISSSVVSDYESGRRKSPGIGFVKKYIESLISEDLRRGGRMVAKFSQEPSGDAIIDIRDFLDKVPAEKLVEAVQGEVISEGRMQDLWGYTVIDSIKAILELSEAEFRAMYGLSERRALIFTKVHMGRSPMIAIKVTTPKPSMIVFHGLAPSKVDRLAVKIAALEDIPLIVSKIKSEEELVKSLREYGF